MKRGTLILAGIIVLILAGITAQADVPTWDGWDFTVRDVFSRNGNELCVRVANTSNSSDKDGSVLVRLTILSGVYGGDRTVSIDQGEYEDVCFPLPDRVFNPFGTGRMNRLKATVEIWGGPFNGWRFYDPHDFYVDF